MCCALVECIVNIFYHIGWLHDEHFIGPEESGESVHDHGPAFGLDDQQNVPPPNQQFFEFI